MDIRKLIQTAQMKEILQTNFVNTQSEDDPANDSSLPDGMNTAFKDILKKTQLPLSNDLAMPPAVKEVIAKLVDSENGPKLPTELIATHTDTLVDAFQKLTDIISNNRLHPVDQFAASASFKTLVLGLITLSNRYQSSKASNALKKAARDISPLSYDAKWLKKELKTHQITDPLP